MSMHNGGKNAGKSLPHGWLLAWRKDFYYFTNVKRVIYRKYFARGSAIILKNIALNTDRIDS